MIKIDAIRIVVYCTVSYAVSGGLIIEKHTEIGVIIYKRVCYPVIARGIPQYDAVTIVVDMV